MKKIIFFLIIICVKLIAQQEVSIEIVIFSPLPAKISEWMNNPNAVTIKIYNAVIGQDAELDISVRLDNNEVASKTQKVPINSNPEEVTAGELDFNTFSIQPSIKDKVYASNLLPEGNYCLYVKFTQGTVVVDHPCESFTILIPDPPTLLNPADGDQVKNFPQFSWTPVTSLYPSVVPKYRIKIVPVFAGQTSRDAIDRNSVLVYDSVFNTTYPYTSANQPFSFFSDAEKFAWQVQAVDTKDNPVTRNEGKSEIFTFSVEGRDSLSLTNIEEKFSSSFIKLRAHHSNNKKLMDLVDDLEDNVRYIFSAINSPDTLYILSLAYHADALANVSASPPESVVVEVVNDIKDDTGVKRDNAEKHNNSKEAFQPVKFLIEILAGDGKTYDENNYNINAVPWALRNNPSRQKVVARNILHVIPIKTLVTGIYDIWAVPVNNENLRYPDKKNKQKTDIPAPEDRFPILIK